MMWPRASGLLPHGGRGFTGCHADGAGCPCGGGGGGSGGPVEGPAVAGGSSVGRCGGASAVEGPTGSGVAGATVAGPEWPARRRSGACVGGGAWRGCEVATAGAAGDWLAAVEG
ncbi:uncharacterized protein LOC131062664 [Cryptomeria japonica]|uniref:uncharacterized protein LOC131062664 n=1 Tax=Cryptomeria japonica TaxID=3369 RepID=UPI0025AD84E8|nr:uncharacterized protein LOC131062664 [Cryptomeria japonica]